MKKEEEEEEEGKNIGTLSRMRNVSGMELSEVSNKAINKLYVCTTGHASFTLLFLFVHSQKALFFLTFF